MDLPPSSSSSSKAKEDGNVSQIVSQGSYHFYEVKLKFTWTKNEHSFFFLYSQHMRSHPNTGYYPRNMHQHHAMQGAGARDRGARDRDQLKDERENELQDTTVGFEATEVTYSHSFKTPE